MFQQAYCLICHEVIRPDIGWKALFSAEKEQLICTLCEGKLMKIEGEACRVCCRPMAGLDPRFRHGSLCHDCFRWEEDPEWQGFLEKNTSLFVYNDFLKEVIARYKYRGDYVLSKVFAAYFKDVIKGAAGGMFVPVPLSGERLYERGFNQAEALIRESGQVPSLLLTRVHSEKQSKKSRTERIHIPQVFQLGPDAAIKGKTIILIDDIYTTGSTLRHAAKVLKTAGAASIQSITLAR